MSPYDPSRIAQQAAQQAANAQRQMMEQSSRRNMQLQQDRLQQLQQQGQMRAWRQPASASPKSRRGASPAPYVPGHRRHRVFVLLLVATGLVAAISVGSAVAAGSDAPHIPGLPGGSAPVEGTSTVVLRVRSGPSSDTTILDRVHPGQPLLLRCRTDNGWDLLADPDSGGYVFDRYVQRSAQLPGCSS
jgi:hypothetical protein